MFEMFTNKLPFEVRGNVEGAAKQQAKWVELHSKGPTPVRTMGCLKFRPPRSYCYGSNLGVPQVLPSVRI